MTFNRVRLGQVSKVKGGKRLPKGGALSSIPNKHPYIRVRDMGEKYLPIKDLEYVPDDIFPQIKNYIVSAGDVILSIVGSVGLISIVNQELNNASLTENCVKIIPEENQLDREFLYYFLNSKEGQDQIKQKTVGAVQPKLPIYNINDLEINLPPLPTQKAIAEILSSVDDKIELNNQINKNLEALAQALFKQWFVDFEFPNENGELYKSSGGEMIDSELGEIPKGWEVTNLGEVFEFTSGFPFKSEDFKEDGIYRIVTIRNVQDGAFLQKTENGIDSIPSKMGDQIKLKESDVILSLTGNVGRTCFVTGENYLLNQRVLKIEPIRNKELTSFPYFFFRRPEIQQHLISISKGTAQLNLSPVEMKNIKIPFQKEISNHLFQKLQTLFDLEIETTKESQQLSDLRDTLLPKLISGELEVNESLLEPTF
jgi:type I restriction enzyme S subunit